MARGSGLDQLIGGHLAGERDGPGGGQDQLVRRQPGYYNPFGRGVGQDQLAKGQHGIPGT